MFVAGDIHFLLYNIHSALNAFPENHPVRSTKVSGKLVKFAPTVPLLPRSQRLAPAQESLIKSFNFVSNEENLYLWWLVTHHDFAKSGDKNVVLWDFAPAPGEQHTTAQRSTLCPCKLAILLWFQWVNLPWFPRQPEPCLDRIPAPNINVLPTFGKLHWASSLKICVCESSTSAESTI